MGHPIGPTRNLGLTYPRNHPHCNYSYQASCRCLLSPSSSLNPLLPVSSEWMHQPSKKLLYVHSYLLLNSEAQVMLLKCKADHILSLLNLPSCFHLEQSTQPSTMWLQLSSALALQHGTWPALSSSGVPCFSRLRAFAHPSFPFPFHGITACSSRRSQLRYHFLWEAISYAPDKLKFLARCCSPAPCGLPPTHKIDHNYNYMVVYLFN